LSQRNFACGHRALGIAFLLAALKEDYFSNKSKLLDALKKCRSLPYPDKGRCADVRSSYLIELAHRGDISLLKPSFDISDLADGAFSESSCWGGNIDRPEVRSLKFGAGDGTRTRNPQLGKLMRYHCATPAR
jgi:hypothetical protein